MQAFWFFFRTAKIEKHKDVVLETISISSARWLLAINNTQTKVRKQQTVPWNSSQGKGISKGFHTHRQVFNARSYCLVTISILSRVTVPQCTHSDFTSTAVRLRELISDECQVSPKFMRPWIFQALHQQEWCADLKQQRNSSGQMEVHFHTNSKYAASILNPSLFLLQWGKKNTEVGIRNWSNFLLFRKFSEDVRVKMNGILLLTNSKF